MRIYFKFIKVLSLNSSMVNFKNKLVSFRKKKTKNKKLGSNHTHCKRHLFPLSYSLQQLKSNSQSISSSPAFTQY